jgi:hypothetical protein
MTSQIAPDEVVRELGREEREAINAGDWDALDRILERQKTLWRRLVGDARLDDGSEEEAAATEALVALYEVRRRNHALIERSFSEMRRRLTTAHAGSGARSAYHRASGRAA